MSTISSSTTSTTAFGVTADTTGALVIQTGATPTTALTIDTSQNVGIGTTSINTKLNVKASGNSYITGALSLLDAAGTNKNYITAVSGNIYFGENSSVDCAVINIYGVGLGGNTPQSGLGVRFPATQSASSDANTLDDYEEGTWTPQYGSAFTGTYAANGQLGYYTKVGRLVTAYFWIQVSTVSGSGGLTIKGFPFTSQSATNYSAGTIIHLASSWAVNTPFSIDGGGTEYNIKGRLTANGALDPTNISVSDLGTNAFMRATLVYNASA
jgi:hypothetical protein